MDSVTSKGIGMAKALGLARVGHAVYATNVGSQSFARTWANCRKGEADAQDFRDGRGFRLSSVKQTIPEIAMAYRCLD